MDKQGGIVSENTYRLNMARKEHKKHVRELLAQAIVHKTLDMERHRQVAIRTKLEEIAKTELVKRVRVSNGGMGKGGGVSHGRVRVARSGDRSQDARHGATSSSGYTNETGGDSEDGTCETRSGKRGD